MAAVGFQHARFISGTVNSGTAVPFRGAEFSGGTVNRGSSWWLEGARFSGGTVDFGNVRFSGDTIDFGSATFSGGHTCRSGPTRICGHRRAYVPNVPETETLALTWESRLVTAQPPPMLSRSASSCEMRDCCSPSGTSTVALQP